MKIKLCLMIIFNLNKMSVNKVEWMGWDGHRQKGIKHFASNIFCQQAQRITFGLCSTQQRTSNDSTYIRGKDILRYTWEILKHTSSSISLDSVSAFRNFQQLQVPLLMVSLASLFCLLGVMGNDASVGLFLMVEQLDKHWLRANLRCNHKSLTTGVL
jgi:hypothetical protein